MIVRMMMHTKLSSLLKLLLLGGRPRDNWIQYRRGIFVDMQDIQLPDFEGIFGEMPRFVS